MQGCCVKAFFNGICMGVETAEISCELTNLMPLSNDIPPKRIKRLQNGLINVVNFDVGKILSITCIDYCV